MKKKFKDLKFRIDGRFGEDQTRLIATADLDPGIKVSVVTMLNAPRAIGGAYGTLPELTFEIAILQNDEFVRIGEYDDVLGYQSPKQVSKIMKKFQS